MEDHNHNDHTIIENNNCSSSSSSKAEKNSNSNSNSNSSNNEPVRSRWTPKPEQILILESIFNSGMVNPPKEETVRIRKVLEKFGAVGDANVFYWFQNRRSRSRRRQRQLQASLAAATQQQQQHPPTPQQHQHNLLAPPPPPPSLFGGSGGASLYDFGHHHHHQNSNNNNNNIISNNNTCTTTGEASSSSVTCFAPSSSCSSTTAAAAAAANLGDCCGGVEDVFGSFSAQMGLIMPTHHHQPPNLEFQSGGIITVFINGVATQVPDGPFDMKAMFGEELMLVHSSGVPVPYNDFGISFHSLQHGESYFLVPRLA